MKIKKKLLTGSSCQYAIQTKMNRASKNVKNQELESCEI